jgi:hypothetical protein
MNVLVTGPGSGSGYGTICVRGSVTDGNEEVLPSLVRVRVVLGNITPPPPSADPPTSYDVDVVPVGQQWCAQNVPIPGFGVQLTAIAWGWTGTSGWSLPQYKWFTTGGPDPIDCCAGSGCTSGGEQHSHAPAFQALPPPPPPFPPTVTGRPS